MDNKFLDSLLNYFNLSKEDYEELIKPYSLDNFSDGHSFKGIDNAANIVRKAMKDNKRIIIYGDYDADGIMGTSILVYMFRVLLKYEVRYYIPSRYLDGYGLNVENAKKCIGKYDLVITVDNGIVANEPIELLRNAGVDVLVIDHHTVQLPLPNANAIVHPEVSKYGDVATSGAYCAFMFSKEMLGYYDKYLATMAAISLISDMMPLRKYNRNLLKAVFASYNTQEFLPIALLAANQKLDENVIGMAVAPRINSIGRMEESHSVNHIVEYFVRKDDSQFVLTYFNHIEETNDARKEISKEASENIVKNAGEEAMVSLLDIKEGLIGLIANAIMNKINKPTVVFTKTNQGTLKGSARSVEGFNIVEAFQALDKYIIQYGGHALAGGCEIKVEDYENFKKEFISLVNSKEIKPISKKTIPLNINDITKENYEIYLSLSPYGEDWKAPLFSLTHVRVDALKYSKTMEHILTPIGNATKIVGFNIAKDKLAGHTYANFIGKLSSSTFRDLVTIEYHISQFNFD